MDNLFILKHETMKEYLTNKFDADNSEHVSITDDLSLWSAPFGQTLLDTIKFKPNIRCLDIGCGTGFPLVELAERLGKTCKVFGIDPWEKALERVNQKIRLRDITNVEIISGAAENLPFENNFFDLIVSNNGINNVQDLEKVLSECYRIMKAGGQFVFTLNLPETMIEFYRTFESILKDEGLLNEIQKMKEHIYEKRKPIGITSKMVMGASFKISNKIENSFKQRYQDGTSFFNHYFTKSHFLPPWKEIIPQNRVEEIFDKLETKLNCISKDRGGLTMTIPYVCFDCEK